MEVHAPKTKERAVNRPRAKSQPVPHATSTKMIAPKMRMNHAQMVYSALRKDSAPS